MNLTAEVLSSYASPFRDWHEDYVVTMYALVTFTGDQDELLLHLFNNVLPFVKHEYTLFTSLVPTIECLSEFLENRSDCAEPVFSFLSYVFSDLVRDNNFLLVDPVQYQYLSPEAMSSTKLEDALFLSAKALYAKWRIVLEGTGFQAYFDTTLLDKVNRDPWENGLTEKSQLTWLLAIALNRYKLGDAFITDSGITLGEPEWHDISEALQGRIFDEDAVYGNISSDALTTDMPWAAGRLGAVSGLVLLMRTSPRSTARARTLEKLVEHCAALKIQRLSTESEVLATDQFLLEDISVVLFREHLAAGKPLVKDHFDVDQALFSSLLTQTYRGHTYSLLYAGVAPSGSNSWDAGLTGSIYDIH